MALVVWFTMGIALWHFTVFMPDRFWQGIVGAFLGAVARRGGLRRRSLQTITGRGLGETDLGTALTGGPRDRDRPRRRLRDRRPRPSSDGTPAVKPCNLGSGDGASSVLALPSLVGGRDRSRHTAPTPIPMARRGRWPTSSGSASRSRSPSCGAATARPSRHAPSSRPTSRTSPASSTRWGRSSTRIRAADRGGGGSPSTVTSTSTGSARPRSWSAPCASWAPSATG